ncbi:sensor histidine kinase [Desulfospira joergensenii]|uniref:sensor histidine kinase n=1 Tax=Desulfospira joergensenii TaxID=53329 RepID=UPI0003B63D39|nr:sensor histidine kinase [Desulfospira joergensenii]
MSGDEEKTMNNRLTPSIRRDFPYYRRLWTRVVVILTVSAFLPLAVLGGGLYAYLSRSIKDKTLENLEMEAVFHAQTIDAFLSDRIRNLRLISKNNSLQDLTAPGKIEEVLGSLRLERPYFQDLGVIGPQGSHLAYAGPYDLKARNYLESPWFKETMARGLYVSDVFTGFRNSPHIIIAVLGQEGDTRWILRATVMSELLDNIVTQVTGQRKGDAFLINQNGLYQTTPRTGGSLMTLSPISVPDSFRGVCLEETRGFVRLTTWLNTVPWLSVVSMEKQDIFIDLQRVRNICLLVALLGGFLMVLAILLTTDNLVSMLETKQKDIHILDRHLSRIAYMASSMELSKGLLSDLTEILSNLHVTAALIREKDSINGRDPLSGQILSEAKRGHLLIDRFVRFVESDNPVVMDLDLNRILRRIIDFLNTRLIEKQVCLHTDYDENLPLVKSEGSALSQVLQNILLNAAHVVKKNGTLEVATSTFDRAAVVTIGENGPGLEPEDMERLFRLDHRTARGDLGFSLSISRSVMERLGGKIFAENRPDQGVMIHIHIPFSFFGKEPVFSPDPSAPGDAAGHEN